MAVSVVKTLRINPKTEKEIYDFVESKGGIKKALKYLFEQYQMNQNIDKIINNNMDKILGNVMERINELPTNNKPVTTIKPKEKPVSNQFLNNFIK